MWIVTCDYIKGVLTYFVEHKETGERKGLVADASSAEYQRGLDDAWEAAKKLSWTEKYGGYGECVDKVFDRTDTFDIFDYSPNEAIEKLKAYEEKQKADDEIKVGDVVTLKCSDKYSFVVTKVSEESVWGVDTEGSWNYWAINEVIKTDKHYDIDKILEDMRE